MQQKEISKSDMRKKVEAWKTINSVLVKANADYMGNLRNLLATKKAEMETLKTKLEAGEGTEDENAEYIFLGGYVKAIEDITGMKK